MSVMRNILKVFLAVLTPTVLVFWTIIRILTLHSKTHYYHLNECLFSTYMRVFLFFFEYLTLSKLFIYGDTEFHKEGRKRALYISNHLSTVDWFICSMLLARQGGIGRTRFVLHKNLKYIPVFGFYLAQDSFVFVDRSNFQAQKAVDVLNEIKDVQSDVWMIIYPEGKRFNPEHLDVIEKSAEFARNNGTKPLRHHLTPRYKGLKLLLDNFRDYVDVIYDVSVVYADADGRPLDHRIRVPQLLNWMDSTRSLHIHVTRIPIHSVPVGDNQLYKWLCERFHIKDQFVENLQNHFYPSDGHLLCKADGETNHLSSTITNGGLHPASDDMQGSIMKAMPKEMHKEAAVLQPLRLIDLLPSLLLFYGVTIYWLVGFGWYGPLSYLAVSVLGSAAGMIYVHYFV
ncbi:1-acyl-sn-glycerol-3-phosphate acyltransferase epsilon [Clonorchis sinensis]|uniref:1-acyl-sn-glycerol-3-phosphate acyltransferase epsilon n=1 Tax=Clonorchis sinensis TaxID=79923 RepID=A0A8T1M314_CLOSI|nr:1-acyl-sn-glycerol-3-phosphate acyltransferase epsilon [Clonorchis sinensis]